MILSPQSTIKTLVSVQGGLWQPTFSVVPNILMTRYFSSDFIKKWTEAMAYIDRIPVFDGDPISGCSEVTSLTLVGMQENILSDTQSTVDAVIVLGGSSINPISMLVRQANPSFTLIVENGVWKVDDIDHHLVASDGKGNSYTMPTFKTTLAKVIEYINIDLLLAARNNNVDTSEKQINPSTDGLVERANG